MSYSNETPLPSPAHGPTTFEAWGLAAQWVGSAAAVLSVIVAFVFGYLTLANSRRSKDAQNRATIAAAMEPMERSNGHTLVADARSRFSWAIVHVGGESFRLVNEGTATAYNVRLRGLTELDKRRLSQSGEPSVLEPGDSLGFTLVSRYTLSGPANVMVVWWADLEGDDLQKVVRVPAE